MAAQNAIHHERSEPAAVEEAAAEAAARLASTEDTAIPSPVRRLQAQLQVDLAQTDTTKRWAPGAALLLAVIPSAAAWWAIIAGAKALIHAVTR